MKYVIIQAGGKGTRMGSLTANKPKALLPFGDKTLLESIASEYPADTNTNIIVITDYLGDVIENYVRSEVSETLRNQNVYLITTRDSGTCAGMRTALDIIPDNQPFTIRWCDVLSDHPLQPATDAAIEVCVADMPCRKSFIDGKIIDTADTKDKSRGVCGIYHVLDKSYIADVPESGEFAEYLNTKQHYLSAQTVCDLVELGTIEQYSAATHACIFASKHNNVSIQGDYVVKRATQPKYEGKLRDEVAWYKWVNRRCNNTAELWLDATAEHNCHYSMKRVEGNTLMNMNCSFASKLQILRNALAGIKCLHTLPVPENPSMMDYKAACNTMYLTKPVSRVTDVHAILSDIIYQRWIVVNGKICPNPFSNVTDRDRYYAMIERIIDGCKPGVIHGDPTFSNIIVKNDLSVKFIDPRGLFDTIPISGDIRYDFAKLYYSAIGGYDFVVSQQFLVEIKPKIGNINYTLASHNLDFAADEIIEASGMSKVDMLMLQSSIWFSLCGYITNNVDAIYLAFAKGCEMYHDALRLENKGKVH